MSKRPSVIGELKLASVSAPEPVAAAEPTRRKANPDVVHTSVYIPKAVHRKLREIAFTTDQKVHDIIMQGIDAALQKYGHPSIEALKHDSATTR